MNRLKRILNGVGYTVIHVQNEHPKRLSSCKNDQFRSIVISHRSSSVPFNVRQNVHARHNSSALCTIRSRPVLSKKRSRTLVISSRSRSKSSIKKKVSFGNIPKHRLVNHKAMSLGPAGKSQESRLNSIKKQDIRSIMPEMEYGGTLKARGSSSNELAKKINSINMSDPFSDLSSNKVRAFGPSRYSTETSSSPLLSGNKTEIKKDGDWLKNVEEFLKELKSSNIAMTKFNDTEIAQYLNESIDWMDKKVKEHTNKFKETASKLSDTLIAMKPNIGSAFSTAKVEQPPSESFSSQASKTMPPSRNPNIELKMEPSKSESVVSVNVDPTNSALLDNVNNNKELSVVVKSNRNKSSVARAKLLTSATPRDNSMKISISENSLPVKQIELLINGEPVSEVKTITARSEKVDMVSSLDQIEIRIPVVQADQSSNAIEKDQQDSLSSSPSILNLQISAKLEKPMVASKNVDRQQSMRRKSGDSGRIQYLNKNTATKNEKYETGKSSAVKDSESAGKIPQKSRVRADGRRDSFEVYTDNKNRVTTKVVPWWTSEESYEKIAKPAAKQPKVEKEINKKVLKEHKVDQAGPVASKRATERRPKTVGSTGTRTSLGNKSVVSNIERINVGFDRFPIEKTERNIAKSAGGIAKSAGNIAKSAGNIAKSSGHREKTAATSSRKYLEKLLEGPSRNEGVRGTSSDTRMKEVFESLKPIEKKKDGTLVDKGAKVSTKQASKDKPKTDKKDSQDNFSSTMDEPKSQKSDISRDKKKFNIFDRPHRRVPDRSAEEYTMGKPPDPIPEMIPPPQKKTIPTIVPKAPHGPAGMTTFHKTATSDPLLVFDSSTPPMVQPF